MGIKANPENVRKIAETNRLIEGGMTRKQALEVTGLKPTTYRSWQERQRVREEERRAWVDVERVRRGELISKVEISPNKTERDQAK